MKASTQLIAALRRAADRIEDPGSDYNWYSAGQCNCGILARECTGITLKELSSKTFGSWRLMASVCVGDSACATTGMKMRSVFESLMALGFEYGDFESIEFADNPKVLDRLGVDDEFNTERKKSAAFVARYFRTQADILEEQLTPAPAPQVQQHPCTHMWLETSGTCLYCCATKPVVQPVEVA